MIYLSIFLIFHFSKVHVNCLLIVYEMGIPTETLMEPGPSETLTAEDTSHVSHARARRIAARRKFNMYSVHPFNLFPRNFFKKSRDNVTSNYKETNFWTIKLLTINKIFSSFLNLYNFELELYKPIQISFLKFFNKKMIIF